MTLNGEELINIAESARKNAYAPYSDFCVGAAILTKSGRIYTGCNVENASYGATCCAERNAFGQAIADGERAFSKIAIVGALRDQKADTPCMPCGICRQVMREFCDDGFEILISSKKGVLRYTLKELLPSSFQIPAED